MIGECKECGRWDELTLIQSGAAFCNNCAENAIERKSMIDKFELKWVHPLRPVGDEDDGGEHARLSGHVRILGTDFHVNAEQVVNEPDAFGETMQESVAKYSYVDDIQNICDGPGSTVLIGGREYLLAITPLSERTT
jgi:hypothetical protein